MLKKRPECWLKRGDLKGFNILSFLAKKGMVWFSVTTPPPQKRFGIAQQMYKLFSKSVPVAVFICHRIVINLLMIC